MSKMSELDAEKTEMKNSIDEMHTELSKLMMQASAYPGPAGPFIHHALSLAYSAIRVASIMLKVERQTDLEYKGEMLYLLGKWSAVENAYKNTQSMIRFFKENDYASRYCIEAKSGPLFDIGEED